MLALLLAGSLVSGPIVPLSPHRFAPNDGQGLSGTPEACRQQVTELTKAAAGAQLFHRLGELPTARQEIAVNRTVDGCPAPVVVRYDVERRGPVSTEPPN